jgi:hypothetical protein
MHAAISALLAQRSAAAVPVYAEPTTGAYCGLLGWRHVVSALAQREQQHKDKDSIWGSAAEDTVAKQVRLIQYCSAVLAVTFCGSYSTVIRLLPCDDAGAHCKNFNNATPQGRCVEILSHPLASHSAATYGISQVLS